MMDHVVEQKRPQRRDPRNGEHDLPSSLEAPGNQKPRVARHRRDGPPCLSHVLIEAGQHPVGAVESVCHVGRAVRRGGIKGLGLQNPRHKPGQFSDMARQLAQRPRLGMRFPLGIHFRYPLQHEPGRLHLVLELGKDRFLDRHPGCLPLLPPMHWGLFAYRTPTELYAPERRARDTCLSAASHRPR